MDERFVLFVTDRNGEFELKKTILKVSQELGLNFDIHQNSLKAITIIESGVVEMVIIDLKELELPGITLLQSVRARGSSIPFIVIASSEKENNLDIQGCHYLTGLVNHNSVRRKMINLMNYRENPK